MGPRKDFAVYIQFGTKRLFCFCFFQLRAEGIGGNFSHLVKSEDTDLSFAYVFFSHLTFSLKNINSFNVYS